MAKSRRNNQNSREDDYVVYEPDDDTSLNSFYFTPNKDSWQLSARQRGEDEPEDDDDLILQAPEDEPENMFSQMARNNPRGQNSWEGEPIVYRPDDDTSLNSFHFTPNQDSWQLSARQRGEDEPEQENTGGKRRKRRTTRRRQNTRRRNSRRRRNTRRRQNKSKRKYK